MDICGYYVMMFNIQKHEVFVIRTRKYEVKLLIISIPLLGVFYMYMELT